MSAFPALAGLLVPAGEAAGGPDSFPPDIEEEANNYFQVRTCSLVTTPTTNSGTVLGGGLQSQVGHQ